MLELLCGPSQITGDFLNMVKRNMQRSAARRTSIVINGEPTAVAAATLGELLAELDYAETQVATARNGEFVPRGARAATQLTAGDRIEIVAPRQGG